MPLLLGDSNVKKLAEIVKEGRNVFMPPYNVPVYDMKKKKQRKEERRSPLSFP